uniref:Adenylate cyclase n=1 Tax=Tetraselmis sp. GSL018 TaxID=582737 RepID=A0A061RZV5_9CHLO
MHQRYMMHEVNKLVWPAPGGIGVHVWEELEESERIANEYNFINGTGLLEQHTTDEYAVLANKELKLEGLDVEGQYFTQAAFQRTMRFCLTDAGEVEICFGTDEGPSGEGPKTAVIIPATVVSGLAAVGLFAGLWYRSVSGRQKQRQARRHPPGLVDPKQLVSIVVTDIEDSTRLWAMFPAAMVRAQELHDKCLRHCLKACQGYEVCTEGDSFTVAFHDPDEAVEWCCMVQEALQGLSWPPPIGNGVGGSFDLRSWHGKKRLRRKGKSIRDRSSRRGSVLPADAILDMEKYASGDDATQLIGSWNRPGGFSAHAGGLFYLAFRVGRLSALRTSSPSAHRVACVLLLNCFP